MNPPSDISSWLQVLGRLHPLLLHLPIGILIGVALLDLVAIVTRRPVARATMTTLVWIAALAAAVAAGTGWLLAEEGGYDAGTLALHRRLGIGVAIASLALALIQSTLHQPAATRAMLVACVALLLPAGHFGSVLTRGADFLTDPLHAHEVASATSAADDSTYAQRIAPIFAQRCTSCHGLAKRKGKLALNDGASVLTGGLHGPVIVPGKPDESEMLRRLRLPPADKDHMPPADKPQPTDDDIDLIATWIAAGAPITGQVPGLSAPAVSMPPADPEALAALNAALVHVEPITRDAPLLWIDFAAVASRLSDAEIAALLAPVAAQVAHLGVSGAPVAAATLEVIARMPNLERLDLRGTPLDDAGLVRLENPQLSDLVLAETRLTDAAVDHLLAMKALRSVYLWHSGVPAEGIARLRAERPRLRIDAGDRPDAAVLDREQEIQLTSQAPVSGAAAKSDAPLKPINTICPVSGSPVDPGYTIVFRGRVIAFCCGKCPGQFWAEPAKYESKLP